MTFAFATLTRCHFQTAGAGSAFAGESSDAFSAALISSSSDFFAISALAPSPSDVDDAACHGACCPAASFAFHSAALLFALCFGVVFAAVVVVDASGAGSTAHSFFSSHWSIGVSVWSTGSSSKPQVDLEASGTTATSSSGAATTSSSAGAGAAAAAPGWSHVVSPLASW